MNRPIRIMLVAAVLGLVCSAGALMMMLAKTPSPAGTVGGQAVAVHEMGLRILPFSLTDHAGIARDESVLRDRWTLASFIFTNCPGACPVMLSRMVEAQNQLEGSPVRFAGFSLDAARDTPDRLRTYAEGLGADLGRWSLLTGDDAQVRRMVEEGLLLVVDKENTAEITIADGSSMKNITHPTRIFLIGPDLRVMEMFDSGDPAEVARMVAAVKRYTQAQ